MLTLTPIEAQLLAYLSKTMGTTISSEHLQEAVWGYRKDVSSSAVKNISCAKGGRVPLLFVGCLSDGDLSFRESEISVCLIREKL